MQILAALTPKARTLAQAFAATRGSFFVVADLETTGLSPTGSEILEIAGLKVDTHGIPFGEFSTLIRVRGGVPYRVTELTGITAAEAHHRGRPIEAVLPEFLDFIGSAPLFFHNASFDSRFLSHAAARLSLPFMNSIHCTLKVARAAWPQLPSHKLLNLARFVGTEAPTHRGMADVRATLAVLLAARALTR
jgi:DNA polymerase III subunit epsilon